MSILQSEPGYGNRQPSFDYDYERAGVLDSPFDPWDLEPFEAPYTAEDALYDTAFGLGFGMVPAACPKGLSDLQVVVWHAGYHAGELAAIAEEMDRLDAIDDVLLAGRDPASQWGEDEVAASRSNGGHPFGWDAEIGGDR